MILGALGQLLARTEAWAQRLHDTATAAEDEMVIKDLHRLHEVLAQACVEYQRMSGAGSAQFAKQIARERRCIERNS